MGDYPSNLHLWMLTVICPEVHTEPVTRTSRRVCVRVCPGCWKWALWYEIDDALLEWELELDLPGFIYDGPALAGSALHEHRSECAVFDMLAALRLGPH